MQVGAQGSSSALSSSLSEAQSSSAGSPASSHSMHVAARHAPTRAGSHFSRASESEVVAPEFKRNPQVPHHTAPDLHQGFTAHWALCSTGNPRSMPVAEKPSKLCCSCLISYIKLLLTVMCRWHKGVMIACCNSACCTQHLICFGFLMSFLSSETWCSGGLEEQQPLAQHTSFAGASSLWRGQAA